MSQSAGYEDTGFRIDADYDTRRWLEVPQELPAEDATRWAKEAADAWSEDLGYPRDGEWCTVLRDMLHHAATQGYGDDAYAVLLHILTPVGEAPSPMFTGFMAVPGEQTPAELARQIVDDIRDQGDAVEPPNVDNVLLTNGTEATVVTAHRRAADTTISTALHVLWPLHELVLAALQVFAEHDIGRVLVMRDDLIALAGCIRLEIVHDAGNSP